MKKKVLCIILATTITVLTACGSDSSDSPTIPEPTKAVAEPTKTAEPTEAPVEVKPTEAPVEAEPTEASVEEDPNIIEGIDFTEFNEGRLPLSEIVPNFTFDTVRLIPCQKYYAEALIKNGDHFTMVKDPNDNGFYQFEIYTPRKVADISTPSIGTITEIADDWIKCDELMEYYLFLPDDLVEKDIPVSFTVVYPDGECEYFNMHIDKDYVVEW